MDWIERLTGFAPDGGNGSLELAFTLAVIAIVAILALGVWRLSHLKLRR
ncbi:MAG TPA: hypothetical protein VF221_15210 [Chloroflexota bacterium]